MNIARGRGKKGRVPDRVLALHFVVPGATTAAMPEALGKSYGAIKAEMPEATCDRGDTHPLSRALHTQCLA